MASDDTNKMLRAIINGQSSMKSELITKIDKLDKKLTDRIDNLDKKIDGVEERLTKRIDIIGLHLENLDEDTPTREEFDELAKKVAVISG